MKTTLICSCDSPKGIAARWCKVHPEKAALARAIKHFGHVPTQADMHALYSVVQMEWAREAFGAVLVEERTDSEGPYAIYAFKEDSVWWTIDDNGLRQAWSFYESRGIERAYATLHDYAAVRMPSWWTPERRFAWRVASSVSPDDPRRFLSRFELDANEQVERITASLETGEEVEA
jgi:hypothetical protein